MRMAKLASFPSRLEAEMAAAVLQSHDIAHTIRGDDVGIFGPGHIGRTVLGVEVWVAESDIEEARRILEDTGTI